MTLKLISEGGGARRNRRIYFTIDTIFNNKGYLSKTSNGREKEILLPSFKKKTDEFHQNRKYWETIDSSFTGAAFHA